MRHIRLLRFLAPAIAGAALLVGALPGMLPGAHALDWCWDDPVINLNGRQVTIKDALYADPTVIAQSVKGSTLTIHIPKGVSARVLQTNNPYYKEGVNFVADNGAWNFGQPINVNIVLTFNVLNEAPTLQAQMTVGTEHASYVVYGTTSSSTTQALTLP